MAKIDTTATRALLDLEGWCTLGDVEEAVKAFESLPDHMQSHRDSLSLFTAFLFRHGRYLECHYYALRGIGLYCNECLFWVIASSCLLASGLVKERNALLSAAAEHCPNEAKFLRDMAAEPVTS